MHESVFLFGCVAVSAVTLTMSILWCVFRGNRIRERIKDTSRIRAAHLLRAEVIALLAETPLPRFYDPHDPQQNSPYSDHYSGRSSSQQDWNERNLQRTRSDPNAEDSDEYDSEATEMLVSVAEMIEEDEDASLAMLGRELDVQAYRRMLQSGLYRPGSHPSLHQIESQRLPSDSSMIIASSNSQLHVHIAAHLQVSALWPKRMSTKKWWSLVAPVIDPAYLELFSLELTEWMKWMSQRRSISCPLPLLQSSSQGVATEQNALLNRVADPMLMDSKTFGGNGSMFDLMNGVWLRAEESWEYDIERGVSGWLLLAEVIHFLGYGASTVLMVLQSLHTDDSFEKTFTSFRDTQLYEFVMERSLSIAWLLSLGFVAASVLFWVIVIPWLFYGLLRIRFQYPRMLPTTPILRRCYALPSDLVLFLGGVIFSRYGADIAVWLSFPFVVRVLFLCLYSASLLLFATIPCHPTVCSLRLVLIEQAHQGHWSSWPLFIGLSFCSLPLFIIYALIFSPEGIYHGRLSTLSKRAWKLFRSFFRSVLHVAPRSSWTHLRERSARPYVPVDNTETIVSVPHLSSNSSVRSQRDNSVNINAHATHGILLARDKHQHANEEKSWWLGRILVGFVRFLIVVCFIALSPAITIVCMTALFLGAVFSEICLWSMHSQETSFWSGCDLAPRDWDDIDEFRHKYATTLCAMIPIVGPILLALSHGLVYSRVRSLLRLYLRRDPLATLIPTLRLVGLLLFPMSIFLGLFFDKGVNILGFILPLW